MTTPLAGILFMLIGTMAIGGLLRRAGRLPRDAAHVLNRVILDVTLPALIVGILAQADLDRAIGGAIVAALFAQLVALAASLALTRSMKLPRATQGAAGLTATFGNTAFFGVPLVVALFGAHGLGPSTAVMIDSVNTTVLMWTGGLVFARALGSGPANESRRSIRSALVTPLTLAVVLGLGLNVCHVALPPIVLSSCDRIGAATTALVFLSLGLSLDLGVLRGRVAAITGISACKLVLGPLAALLIVRALHLHGAIAQVTLVQAAMPTAMVSVILAAETGCDGAFASGAAVATTLLSTLTLPLVIALTSGL